MRECTVPDALWLKVEADPARGKTNFRIKKANKGHSRRRARVQALYEQHWTFQTSLTDASLRCQFEDQAAAIAKQHISTDLLWEPWSSKHSGWLATANMLPWAKSLKWLSPTWNGLFAMLPGHLLIPALRTSANPPFGIKCWQGGPLPFLPACGRDILWQRWLGTGSSETPVYYEVFNCYRKSKFTGIVLFFITPRVRNHYTNLELPGLSLDLYNAYQDGCTPFYEDGKEVIPYTYVGFKRCGVDELSNYLQQEISMAGKAGTIVSCSEEDWVKAQNISEKWEVGWLAKRKTDQRWWDCPKWFKQEPAENLNPGQSLSSAHQFETSLLHRLDNCPLTQRQGVRQRILLARVTNMRAFSHEVHHVHQETPWTCSVLGILFTSSLRFVTVTLGISTQFIKFVLELSGMVWISFDFVHCTIEASIKPCNFLDTLLAMRNVVIRLYLSMQRWLPCTCVQEEWT